MVELFDSDHDDGDGDDDDDDVLRYVHVLQLLQSGISLNPTTLITISLLDDVYFNTGYCR